VSFENGLQVGHHLIVRDAGRWVGERLRHLLAYPAIMRFGRFGRFELGLDGRELGHLENIARKRSGEEGDCGEVAFRWPEPDVRVLDDGTPFYGTIPDWLFLRVRARVGTWAGRGMRVVGRTE
jgi:hypothetical protein